MIFSVPFFCLIIFYCMLDSVQMIVEFQIMPFVRKGFSFLGRAGGARGGGSQGSSWACGSFVVLVALLACFCYFGVALLSF